MNVSHETGRRDILEKISNMASINNRLHEVVYHIVPDHWYGKLVMGAIDQGALDTIVLRKTNRFVILVLLKVHTIAEVRDTFMRNIRHLPE
jgi:IS30 family transposase